MKPFDLIIHHADCLDGVCAAWVALRHSPQAQLHPAKYGDAPPDCAGKRVLVVDFSYPREQLLAMAERAAEVVLLDHHRSAEQDLALVAAELAGIARIPLSGRDGENGEAYVDVADVDKVSKFTWNRAVHGGAVAYVGGGRAASELVYMHHLILPPTDGLLVDHANRNTLDNRRGNLRLATKQQNAANMDRGSKWKGVRRSRHHWSAQITIDGKNKYLGVFDSPEEAARAYDAAAVTHFGEFAFLNFPGPVKLVPPNLTIVFDMNRSGAGLAWDTLFADVKIGRPMVVDYVEDRDLWKWRLPHSHEVSAALQSYPLCVDTFKALGSYYEPLVNHVVEGAAILRYQRRLVDEAAKRARDEEIGGVLVPCVESTVLKSEIGERLSDGKPFAAIWSENERGERVYSLRSREGGMDVSEIAKKYGGGGHARAAGFTRRP